MIPQSDSVRRQLPKGAVLAQWAAADGWALRHFRWDSNAVPPRGSILFQGGRGDIPEKYFEAFAHWHDAGWGVESFDWRGQGGSGRLSADPMVGHVEDFATWVADLAAFFADWRARTPAPHGVIAHSMGGHLLLRALAEGRIAPDAAVLVAPMLGLQSGPLPARIARIVAHGMTRIGSPARLAWKVNERPAGRNASREAFLTHDRDRYADELWWKTRKPELALGPPSWRWLACAYDSTLALERPGVLEAVATPLLILAAAEDRLVDPAAIRRAARRLPDAALHLYGPESAHEILREVDAVRDDALGRIDTFLAARAPAAAR